MLDINNLSTITPKSQQPIQNNLVPVIEDSKHTKNINDLEDCGEYKPVVSILEPNLYNDNKNYINNQDNQDNQNNQTSSKPIIDLYVLSKNCTEYINHNLNYTNMLNQNNVLNIIDKNSNIIEQETRNFIKSIQRRFADLYEIEELVFETPRFIFKDYIWQNYDLYFPEFIRYNLLSNLLLSYISIPTQTNFYRFINITQINKQTYYNIKYCNFCTFKEICQRRHI